MTETLPSTDTRYLEGLKTFQQLEYQKWKTFIKTPCKAFLNSPWNKNTCKVTDRDCNFKDCFALQIIKVSKGYL